MKTNRTNSRRDRGYTLIEALVAGVILMIGISAASQLTLTLITQEEMNRRTTTALNYQENVAGMYRLGFDEAEIDALVPDDPVVQTMTLTPGVHDLGGGMGNMDFADITVAFNPVPADSAWSADLWTGGDPAALRTSTIQVYLSVPPADVE
jgi:type II secretory pathway pseudopilin PulG